MNINDSGPWNVCEFPSEKIGVQSDDFTYDVFMEITGDFIDKEQKLSYADFICSVLNKEQPND